ncbi:MAG: NAD-dependent epimerase/dehydratase family protein, partial [Candidatus Paceibacterota bacterium]
MNYLVTGGAGFIGSHLANRLFDDGHMVRVLDNLSFGDRAKLNPNIELIEGDIIDPEICNRSCKNIDGIFHLAAFSRSGPSFDKSDLCNAS